MHASRSTAAIENRDLTDVQGAPNRENPWHSRLYSRFSQQPYPLLVFPDGIVPAASLWAGARRWVTAFRSAGMKAGDRLVVSLPASPAFLQVLLAGLWEQLTLALLPPEHCDRDAVETIMTSLDARAGVTLQGGIGLWSPESCSGPREERIALRVAQRGPTPDARLLLCTSGTTGAARWIALSDRNLLAVIDSHLPHLDLRGAIVLSVLPWHHAFGLIVDLLPALFAGAEIVREPSGGRDIESVLHYLSDSTDETRATHLSAVPRTVQRLMQTEAGIAVLQRLRGGVIGGAPVSVELASLLSATRLRVGYGQTEASPGIALGAPGVWKPHYLGRPIGCCVRIDARNELQFAGPNACLGYWTDSELRVAAPERWVRTGDMAREDHDQTSSGGLLFMGRADDTFKLSNGRAVNAGYWECRIKEAFPTLREALLYSPDGERLLLGQSVSPGSEPPTLTHLRAILGALGAHLTEVRDLPGSILRRTPKDEIDRAAARRALKELESDAR